MVYNLRWRFLFTDAPLPKQKDQKKLKTEIVEEFHFRNEFWKSEKDCSDT